MRKLTSLLLLSVPSLISIICFSGCANDQTSKDKAVAFDSTALILPTGFTSTIVADSIGNIRHLTVNNQGDIYVKLSALRDGKGIYMLRDTNHDGLVDQQMGFGNYPGTGILAKDNVLYASSNSGVYKYALNDKGEVVDTATPVTLVKGLVDRNMDNSKSIAVDDQDNLYVTVGSYNEGCTGPNSVVGMPGCPLLDSLGGVWQFKTNITDQSYGNSIHYARGLKNPVGLFWNSSTKSLFATSHGRGRLAEKFPQYYTKQQDLELPAETLYELGKGVDAGWPFVYYDQIQKKQMLSPEYGGDGKKSIEGKYIDPVAAFPAHFAPNDLLFYTGTMFPERYRNGAFLVFHNRSAVMNKGYLVAFVPFQNGKPSGAWEIFADNFAGYDLSVGKGPIEHRPMGIAQGPDGSLYIADDIKGTIYRITYSEAKK